MVRDWKWCLQARQVIWSMVELICLIAWSFKAQALSSSASACCRILLALVNSSSASSICLLACFLASSAYAFSATAILSCSRASSWILSPNDFSLVFVFSNDPMDSCNCEEGFPSLLLPVGDAAAIISIGVAVESWSSRLGWSLFSLL